MSVHIMEALARNNAFSNKRLLDACSQLDAYAFRATRTSFFPSICETANHILSVDLYYIDALREGGRGQAIFDDFVPFETAAPLAAAQTLADRDLLAFCTGLGEADLDREVVTDRGDEGTVPERIGALLLHLFQHQIHHRGQIHAMLAGTAVPPPQLDEFFLRYDRQARRADFAALGFEDIGPTPG
jgi:uncharacterized damage-inducible protein DinB